MSTEEYAGISVVAWADDDPISLSAQPQYDESGDIFICLQVGSETALFRPDEDFQDALYRLSLMSYVWASCHYDAKQRVCDSPTCRHRPGGIHVGRIDT